MLARRKRRSAASQEDRRDRVSEPVQRSPRLARQRPPAARRGRVRRLRLAARPVRSRPVRPAAGAQPGVSNAVECTVWFPRRRIMEKNGSVRALNERLARKIRREGQANPKSPYANRFVGLANGKVVVIADTLTEMH